MGIHDERRARRAAYFGLVEEAPASLSMSNTKPELLAAAEEAGLEVDESMTKAELLEVLEGDG